LDGRSRAASSAACSRTRRTRESPPSSGTRWTLSARAMSGRSGARPTAGRASPCRPWEQDTGRVRRDSATFKWEVRTKERNSVLTKDKAQELFKVVQKHSSADETEVLIHSGAHALTRFANNTIHQNVAEESSDLSVRVVLGGRTARASTNKLDDESVR